MGRVAPLIRRSAALLLREPGEGPDSYFTPNLHLWLGPFTLHPENARHETNCCPDAHRSALCVWPERANELLVIDHQRRRRDVSESDLLEVVRRLPEGPCRRADQLSVDRL